MSFGLNNVGATYMRAMTTIFHDMIHKEIEVYVHDVIIKSHESSDHLTHLRKFFDHLHRYNLKLNPAKCAFGVPGRKLLGFIVNRRGIELDPSKIKAIQELPPPKMRKQLLKKDVLTKWAEQCQSAFDAIKNYLSNQPKAIKAQALTDHLAKSPVDEERTPDLGLLKCVDAFEATELFEQIHTGVCGPHMNGLTLARKILRAAWGMDVIGTIEPATSNGYRFILVAIDYFTKWVEATFYKSVTNKVVADFVRKNLYAVSEYQMNGAVEASNKNIKKILRKMIDNHRGWHEMFPYALLGYRTTVIISIGATPYLLVYGTKAVIPAEVKILSVSIIKEVEFSNAEWRMIRAFHKRVRARIFEVGQLVLQRIFPHQDEYKGKFAPNWQGPYMVRKVLSGGVLVLSEMDGTVWPKPINTYALKRYCV
nr:uncharacterized protein LOC101260504 [Solanum lycopersicum]